MKRYWFVERTINIILNGFDKYRNKKGTKTKLKHNRKLNGNKSVSTHPDRITDNTYKLICKV